MTNWLQEPITGKIQEVPGIGPATAKILAEAEGDSQVTNTYQLFGRFLLLKGPDTEDNQVESIEHMEKFWYWLKVAGVTANRK